MESAFRTDEDVRISDSPRRSPQVTQGLESPVRSVYPQMQQMDSIYNQADLGMRTTDFFEDSSEDEFAHVSGPAGVTDVDLLERKGSATKKRPQSGPVEPHSQCESKTTSARPDSIGYQRLSAAFDDKPRDTPSTSFHGSVDELLPGGSSPPPLQRKSRIVSSQIPRSSVRGSRSENRSTKTEQALGAYAIAHEITLQALMRDENALDTGMQSLALTPLQSRRRQSVLLGQDPRSPMNNDFSTQRSEEKKVHIVPPPIDIAIPHGSIPENIVRTPFPFSPESVRQKDFGQSQNSRADSVPGSTSESILTLSILQTNCSRRPRVTTLTIPASNDFSAVRSSSAGAKEQYFKAIEYDDYQLFTDLRRSYFELVGPMRFLSARSLTRIAVSGIATRAADAQYGWISLSPHLLSSRGLSDVLGEEKILQHYQRPALGKSRYAFVQWAHRLAAAPAAQVPQLEEHTADGVSRGSSRCPDQPEGLVFVVSWSAARILLALAIVLVISMAAALLWIFLGPTVAYFAHHGSFHGAGDRVTSGVVIGICVLLLGVSGIGGWLGVSWLIV